MAEEKPNYYVVSIDLAFLGIHVEAADEDEAQEKAFAVLSKAPAGTVGIEAGIRNVRVQLIADEDETSGSTVLKLLS